MFDRKRQRIINICMQFKGRIGKGVVERYIATQRVDDIFN